MTMKLSRIGCLLASTIATALQLSAQTRPAVEMLYSPIGARLQVAITNSNPVANVAIIARQAEAQYAKSDPAVVVRVHSVAIALLNRLAPNHPDSAPTVFELTVRERMFIESIPLTDRIWRLRRDPLPLSADIEVYDSAGGDARKTIEMELLLKSWRELIDEIERTENVDDLLMPHRPLPPRSASQPRTDGDGRSVVAFITESTPPEQVQDPVEREQYGAALAAYQQAGEQKLYRSRLGTEGSSFTNAVIRQVAREYAKAPHLVAQLQEVMDGYLPPEISTNVMNKVFASMKPEMAAKTPRPVPGAKGERWIRPPAPRPEPGLPAIAKPSKIREGISNRNNQGVVATASSGTAAGAEPTGSGAEQSGSRPIWPWAVLGLAALAGGWFWLRAR